MLDRDLLSRWMSVCEERSGGAAPGLEPGVDGDVLGSWAHDAGLRLPIELREWWRTTGGQSAAARFAGTATPTRSLLTPSDALKWKQRLTQTAQDTCGDWGLAAEDLWAPTWVPILGNRPFVVVDVSASGEAPVRVVDWASMQPQDWQRVRLQSMGALVQQWIDLIDSGLWWWDRDAGRWQVRWDEVPDHLKATGLAE